MQSTLIDGLFELNTRFDELLARHGLSPDVGPNSRSALGTSRGTKVHAVPETLAFEQAEPSDGGEAAMLPKPDASILFPGRPTLPNPGLIRQIIRGRQLRSRYFAAELFADPAWDMLLELAASQAKPGWVSETALSNNSNVAPATALRWIDAMAKFGLVERRPDQQDSRRINVALTDAGSAALAKYFRDLGWSAESVT